jgi:hypothetical protein
MDDETSVSVNWICLMILLIIVIFIGIASIIFIFICFGIIVFVIVCWCICYDFWQKIHNRKYVCSEGWVKRRKSR